MTDRVKIKEALEAVVALKVYLSCQPITCVCRLNSAPCCYCSNRTEAREQAEKLKSVLTDLSASQAATKPAGGEWLPIESAPRDGSRILLTGWHGKDVKLWCGVGYGHFYKPGNRFEYDGYQFGNPDHQPTHWQPLPAPPLTRKENGE